MRVGSLASPLVWATQQPTQKPDSPVPRSSKEVADRKGKFILRKSILQKRDPALVNFNEFSQTSLTGLKRGPNDMDEPRLEKKCSSNKPFQPTSDSILFVSCNRKANKPFY